MLTQTTIQKKLKDNLCSLDAKRTFLNDQEAFGQYLKSNSDFKSFCSEHQLQLFSDSVIVRNIQEVESFTNLVYQYNLQIIGVATKPHDLIVYAKSYLSFTKGDPSFVFEENLKSRSLRETAAIKEFKNLNIDQLVVPFVILCDSERELFISLGIEKSNTETHITPNNDLSCNHLSLVCNVLAKIHSQTYLPLLVTPNDIHSMDSTLYFRGTLARQTAEENTRFATSWHAFIKDTLSLSFCRLHGNLTPRNIKVLGDSKVAFFDFEFSMRGDPAFDLGTLLGHYILEMIVHPASAVEIQTNLPRAWEVYSKNQSMYSKGEIEKLESRVIKYIALTLFYRSWFKSSWRLESINVSDKLAKLAINIFNQNQLVFVLDYICKEKK